jgi:type I restriction enzyme M protein
MISKMRNDETGSRIGIVMNGSPLFTGGAASGESEIRRWMLENDWVEAIIALPTDLFYNTGIQTYVWLLTNRKEKRRIGKVQLIDASGPRFWKAMRKSLGSKRREIPEEERHLIVSIYAGMENGGGEFADVSKTFDTSDFGYREIRVERPLRLSFAKTPERLEALAGAKAFLKLDDRAQKSILAALEAHLPSDVIKSRPPFEAALAQALKGVEFKIGAPLKKAILAALSERDEAAEICRDANGKAERDPDLRDFELVPLKEDWKTYFAREVTPFVPDAWVDTGYCDEADGQIGCVGYEIDVDRYFYRYVPPRPLEVIDSELKTLEEEIVGLLKGGRDE